MANDVAGCVELMNVLAPGFEEREVALEELRVGVAWTEDAEPLVRARVEEAAGRFPDLRRVEFPRQPPDMFPLFMREVADVHRELLADNADAYGDNVRTKVERCLRVTDAEVTAALRAREEYRARAADAMNGLDLLVTPTLPIVPPPADCDEIELRASLTANTYPFNALGWPALALPCGRAEGGLPASIQLVARAGDDALVLAAGRAFETAFTA